MPGLARKLNFSTPKKQSSGVWNNESLILESACKTGTANGELILVMPLLSGQESYVSSADILQNIYGILGRDDFNNSC
jgi:hypothetical protein